MKQHSIDLMPESIRDRAEAGMLLGRVLTALAVAAVVLFLTTAHAHWRLRKAQETLFAFSAQAEEVYAAEARATELKNILDQARAHTAMYDKLALPLDISAVIATVVNLLPSSVTLDQIDVDTGARLVAAGRTARSKGAAGTGKDEAPPRVLNAELSGFAANDQQIAELVSRLSSTAPLRDVSLDFSRSRDVHGFPAREFRLSFKIDLDAKYEIKNKHARSDEARRHAGMEARSALISSGVSRGRPFGSIFAAFALLREETHVQ